MVTESFVGGVSIVDRKDKKGTDERRTSSVQINLECGT